MEAKVTSSLLTFVTGRYKEKANSHEQEFKGTLKQHSNN